MFTFSIGVVGEITTVAPVSGDFTCDFEDNSSPWCGILQLGNSDDQFDWTRHSGKTPSSPTGPDMAASGSYYIYIEATGRREGDTAM